MINDQICWYPILRQAHLDVGICQCGKVRCPKPLSMLRTKPPHSCWLKPHIIIIIDDIVYYYYYYCFHYYCNPHVAWFNNPFNPIYIQTQFLLAMSCQLLVNWFSSPLFRGPGHSYQLVPLLI